MTLTTAQLADQLGIPVATLNGWASQGLIEGQPMHAGQGRPRVWTEADTKDARLILEGRKRERERVAKLLDRIVDFIVSCVETRGYPPTVREIGDEVALAVSTVHFHLTTLVEEGRISVEPDKPRAITVLERAS